MLVLCVLRKCKAYTIWVDDIGVAPNIVSGWIGYVYYHGKVCSDIPMIRSSRFTGGFSAMCCITDIDSSVTCVVTMNMSFS